MRRHPWVFLFGILLLFAGVLPAADERAKVPDADAQAQAEKLIKELFKADFAKKKPADLVELSGKLLQQGLETKDEPAARYVLFREAATLAGQGGDVAQGLKAVEELARHFTVNPAELKATLFEKAAPLLRTIDGNKLLIDEALLAINEAVAADEFDVADRLLKVADASAHKLKNLSLTTAVTARSKEVARIRKEFDQVKEALATLEKDPKDAAANLAAGKYLCFLKGNWEKGLPMLVHSNDAILKPAAEKDLANPNTAAAQVDVGDAWYDLAASQDPTAKLNLQLRALSWYEQAAPGLAGLTKTKVEKRVAELEKVAEGRRDRGDLFSAIRDGIKDKKTTDSRIIGGAFSKQTFREVPPEGAVLIGFHYTLGKFVNNDVMDCVQPIFLTARGEKLGTAYGRPIPGATIQTVKAKQGYAVGAMTVRGGGGFDGFSLTFMKLDKKGLKMGDSYTSDWIGGKGGSEGTVGGDGSLIVGIHGKKNDKEKMGALAAVMLNLKD